MSKSTANRRAAAGKKSKAEQHLTAQRQTKAALRQTRKRLNKANRQLTIQPELAVLVEQRDWSQPDADLPASVLSELDEADAQVGSPSYPGKGRWTAEEIETLHQAVVHQVVIRNPSYKAAHNLSLIIGRTESACLAKIKSLYPTD